MNKKQKKRITIRLFFEARHDFLNNFRKRLSPDLLKKSLIKCLEIPQFPREINIVFVDNDKIEKLNSKYRNIDRPTDVLSFNYQKEEAYLKNSREKNYWDIGEIYISSAYIQEKSKKTKKELEEEVINALIHGLLHLSGFKHYNKKEALKMKERQNRIKEYITRATSSAG